MNDKSTKPNESITKESIDKEILEQSIVDEKIQTIIDKVEIALVVVLVCVMIYLTFLQIKNYYKKKKAEELRHLQEQEEKLKKENNTDNE